MRELEKDLKASEASRRKLEQRLEATKVEDQKKTEEIHLLRKALAQLGGSQTELVATVKEGMRAKEENMRLARELMEARRRNEDLTGAVATLQGFKAEAERLRKVLE